MTVFVYVRKVLADTSTSVLTGLQNIQMCVFRVTPCKNKMSVESALTC